jgi:DNA-binding NarL/FixJ family response regulator
MPPSYIDILQKVADGLRYADIAAERGTTMQTVKNQAQKILELLGADTISQAVAMGLRRGLIS